MCGLFFDIKLTIYHSMVITWQFHKRNISEVSQYHIIKRAAGYIPNRLITETAFVVDYSAGNQYHFALLVLVNFHVVFH